MAETVKVIVRCRPMNGRENGLGCSCVVKMDGVRGQCSLNNPADEKAPPKSFTFDGAYFTDSTTEQIYADIAYPLVEGVTEGYNGTIFAYGQTGCGKSFSMQGITDPATQRGIIPRAFDHVFETISVAETTKFLIHASYLEIYNEEIRDLLGRDTKQKLDLKEHPDKGVYVSGLSTNPVHNVTECQRVMETGWKNRSTGSTLMNADSSRSHSIFTIHLEMADTDDSGEEHIRAGKLNLVDLAGSERQAKTGATGDRLKEATKINLSLSALGNVISALVDGKSKHIPYRDSKLTRLLQDSLGGNTKTLMVACLSPADNNYDETLSTLRYANRAKNIKNKPKINEDPKDALLRQYQEEIQKLKAMLMGQMPIPDGEFDASDLANLSLPGEQVQTKVIEKVVHIGDTEALEAEKQRIREEYDEQLAEMTQLYEEEKLSKEQLQVKMNEVKNTYDEKIEHVEDEIKEEKKQDSKIKLEKTNKLARRNIEGLDEEDEEIVDIQQAIHMASIHDDDSPGLVAPRTSPTVEDRQAIQHQHEEVLKSDMENQMEALHRLASLQREMVGGEALNNEEVRERRTKKKRHAEEKKRKLLEANKDLEDGGIMANIYDSIQDELKGTRKLLEKEKAKSESLERDVLDIQSEFEFDRIDYLDTIREQDKQIKMLNALLEKIQPTVRKDCNYSNLDRVKRECHWDNDSQMWNIPALTVEKTSLPTGGIMPGARMADPRAQPRMLNGKTSHNEDKYLQKLKQKDHDNAASNYFKTNRANQLLTLNDTQRQLKKPHSTSSPVNSRSGMTSPLSNGSTPWHSGEMNGGSPWLSNSSRSPVDDRAATVHGQVSGEDIPMRRPTRLSSLPPTSAKTRKKKKQTNMLEQL